MTDLNQQLRALGPTHEQVRRTRARVDADLEAVDTPLFSEWLDLVRARPLVYSLAAMGAAALLLMLSPLASLPLLLIP